MKITLLLIAVLFAACTDYSKDYYKEDQISERSQEINDEWARARHDTIIDNYRYQLDKMLAYMRPATKEEYEKWLTGYKQPKDYTPIDYFEEYSGRSGAYNTAFFIATSDSIYVEPFYGAMSICIIIPDGVKVELDSELGQAHNVLLFMKDHISSEYMDWAELKTIIKNNSK